MTDDLNLRETTPPGEFMRELITVRAPDHRMIFRGTTDELVQRIENRWAAFTNDELKELWQALDHATSNRTDRRWRPLMAEIDAELKRRNA